MSKIPSSSRSEALIELQEVIFIRWLNGKNSSPVAMADMLFAIEKVNSRKHKPERKKSSALFGVKEMRFGVQIKKISNANANSTLNNYKQIRNTISSGGKKATSNFDESKFPPKSPSFSNISPCSKL